jgi:hypothetical protein
MNIDEYDVEREGSAPIDMLEHYFTRSAGLASAAARKRLCSSFQGSWSQYELRGIWRDEDHVLQFWRFPIFG